MIKGVERESSGGGNFQSKKYVGFTSVEVKAINPTRSQLNALLGKEDSQDDKELSYVSEDQEGNKRVRLSFWLYDEILDRYFQHSFTLTDKIRLNKDSTKTQFINSTCSSSWSDKKENLQEWFTQFKDKTSGATSPKEVREALVGEDQLISIVRTWLGRMAWNDPNCSVMINTDMLFNEDYSELRSLIDGDFATPFVVLLGIKTDESNPDKQYQTIWEKSFLPSGFMNYINKGFSFPTEYTRKVWDKFVSEVEGEYGFTAYFELVPCVEYDATKDVAKIPGVRLDVTPDNSKF
jgi:hypothetical protein